MTDFSIALLEENLSKLKIKRPYSRTNIEGIGKMLGRNIWVHVSAIHTLPSDVNVKQLIDKYDSIINPSIVRYDHLSKCVALIECNDFDLIDEPTVGNSLLIKSGGETTLTKQGKNPLIYHHKWLMVSVDYKGFDIASSMKRSLLWKSLLGTNAALSSRIGRKSFWEQWTKEVALHD